MSKLEHLVVVGTNITDITPLVQNQAFASGAQLTFNGLSCATQQQNLDALSERGVELVGNCQ